MVQEATEARGGQRFGVVGKVVEQLGIGVESLRQWVKQADIHAERGGLTTDERRRWAELEKENRELRRANEILKSALTGTSFGLERVHEAPRWHRLSDPRRQTA